MNLIFEGGGVPERLRERFERDFTTSRPVTAATLDARGPWTRLVDALASLLLRLV